VSRALGAILCVLLMLPIASTSPVLAADPIATTTTVAVDPDIPWSVFFPITATVTPTPGPNGIAEFTISDAGATVVAHSLIAVENGVATAQFSSGALGVGTFDVVVQFHGIGDWQPSSGQASFDAGDVTTTNLRLVGANSRTIVPGGSAVLRADMTGTSSGNVDFYETVDGVDVLLGTTSVHTDFFVFNSYHADLTIDSIAEGSHHYVAHYLGSFRAQPSSAVLDRTVAKAGTTTSVLFNPTTVESGTSINVGWSVFAPESDFPASGTVELRNETTNELLASGGLTGQVTVETPVAGTFTLSATYSGDDHYAGSTKAKALTVKPDVVHAHAVAIQYATFYPEIDGYRDSDRFAGIRDEPISVGIFIYNSNGTRVRNDSIAKGSGSYSWTWKGKNNAGHLVASGKYKVVQRLTDARRHSLSVTKYVTVSHKTIHYSTVTLNKLGNHPTATGHAGVGKVRLLSDGSAQLDGSSGGKAGWAAVGYQFSLPAAAVYKNMKVAVYASTFGSTLGQPKLRAQDFSRCAYKASTDWDDSCFDTLKHVALSTTWTSAPVATKYRHNHVVRAAVTTVASTTVWKVRFTVTIGVLK